MQLVINTTDGGNLTVEDFDPASLMTAYIPKAAVTRIDSIDEPG